MMNNSLGRKVSHPKPPFSGSESYRDKQRTRIPTKSQNAQPQFVTSLDRAFDLLHIRDHMTLSFHHHLRSGDFLINQVAELLIQKGISAIHLAPSSIFPQYLLGPLIDKGIVHHLYTSYLNGPLSQQIRSQKLKGDLIMQTHGGRARAIESGELQIDVAFLSCPVVDRQGNGSGAFGKSACGTLGYALSDMYYAKKVVLVTDTIVDRLDRFQFEGRYVDMVVQVPSIGDPKGIVSGTTRITRDPIGLKIATQTARILDHLGVIKEGFSMQTGAGGTSLATADQIRQLMLTQQVRGSFASGGITRHYVDMLKQGLFSKLYDVQCFDLQAVESYHQNENHIGISASKYGNPFEDHPIVNDLDVVILGATEIDIDFNVNVTTDSFGNIIGGSGGHADTAYGAKITVITSPLARARIPLIKEHVRTITTPGENIDILVTERGIAINPRRADLIDKLAGSPFNIRPIKDLMDLQHQISGIPHEILDGNHPVGYVEYRDGTIIDTLYCSR